MSVAENVWGEKIRKGKMCEGQNVRRGKCPGEKCAEGKMFGEENGGGENVGRGKCLGGKYPEGKICGG